MQMMDVHSGSLDALCDLSPTAVCISSGGPIDNRYVKVNTAYLDLIGRSANDVVGRQLVGTAAVHDEARERRLHLLTTNGCYALEDAVIQHASGSLIPVLISAQVRVVGGGAVHIEVIHDNTQRKAFESQVAKAAFNDALTGLPNRYAFDRTLAATLTQRRSGEAIGLAYLDLNGFKAINDTHGHGVGDGLLRLFARRLRSRSKTGDFVARLGGDEFAILFKTAAGREGEVERHLQRLATEVCQGASVGDQRLEFGVAIGAAIASGWTSADRLLSRADQLMYQAKRTKQRVAVVIAL